MFCYYASVCVIYVSEATTAAFRRILIPSLPLLGQYNNSLDCALELQDKVAKVMGTKCAIYASCLNNVALMHKMVRGDRLD